MPDPTQSLTQTDRLDATSTYEVGTRAPAAPTAPRVARPSGGGVQFVEGPTVGVEGHVQSVLHQRLRAASIVVCAGFGLFLIRSYFVPRPLQGFHTLLVFIEGACIALLTYPRTYTLKQLRLFELVIFGLPILFFVPYQHLFMLNEANRGNAALTLAAFKSVALYWLVTMVFYGLIVPNTWRRAAAIIVPLTLLQPLAALLAKPWHVLINEVLTLDQVSDVLLVLMVGAICSIYGTFVMNSLRQEAIEARRFGQYRLLTPLGEGAMGQVYLAEHRLLKRPCAIKLIHPNEAGKAGALLRFEREVRATAQLTHWNTIKVYDYGCTDDGTFYYVMEYLQGMDLAEVLRLNGPLPAARVVHLWRQLCQALREAHANGLIHRDIKPSNVIVTKLGHEYDVVKLLDFGLVKPLDQQRDEQLTMAGSIAGTPRFMSPEQGTGEPDLDARSDIYSLGVVAYLLLTGRSPYERATPMETIVAHIRDPLTPPSTLRPDIPADLEAVVLRCLEKRRDKRFPHIESLGEALDACECARQWTQLDARAWWKNRLDDSLPTLAAVQ